MTQIAISEQAASTLAFEAQARGCSQEELASWLIEEGLRVEEDFELTPEQQASLVESYAQARRGEVIDGDIVMAEFDRVLENVAAK